MYAFCFFLIILGSSIAWINLRGRDSPVVMLDNTREGASACKPLEQIMSADKQLSIFSHQMATFVF